LVAANAQGSATGSSEVVVRRGGTLAGSGLIAGPVTLMDGGVIAPGDPVTLSLNGGLTWNGGRIIRLVLGSARLWLLGLLVLWNARRVRPPLAAR
jgi:fibronectin-binding autotransporter adhesin